MALTFEQMLLIQAIISGLFMGGLYILVSMGVSLIYGLMDLVNFAHGSFLMLSMYASFWLFRLLNIDPYLSLPIVAIIFFIIGWSLQKTIIQRVITKGVLTSQFIVTFGIMLFIENMAVVTWHHDPRMLTTSLTTMVFRPWGIAISLPLAVTFSVSIAVSCIFHLLVKKTWVGLALRATSQNRDSAEIMGINVRNMFALAFAIGISLVSIGGVLLSTFYPVTPYVGLSFLLISFIVCVLGGLGNYVGAIFGGLIIGIMEGLFGFLIVPHFKQIGYLLVFIIILAIRPQGLLGTKAIRGG